MAQAAAEIHGALALAGAADREAAGRLAELATAAATGWVRVPPAWRPAPGAGPAEVSRWWAGLTPAERRWLVGHEPDRVGRLDGVPVAARDQANRLLLARRRAELLERRAGLLRPLPAGPLELARLARLAGVEAALRGLDGLGERLAAPGAPRAYLLGLDPAGDGRAVVALGNPGRAGAVLTYVPGMTADLADAPAELGRAARVLDRCAALGPGTEAAAVLWLDYDAPDFLPEAARDRQAEELARRALLAGTPLGRAAALLDPHDDRLWFGTDPSTPGFGGRRFPSGPHGHAGYWDPGNPALDGMARIVLGR
ncbi:alpha/beta hydrolase [Micromonospora fulviviridis]|uniref:Alpha/beta hydrolase n=1 Tax=Micromonospora fulviviridis TaxID=47860 RepID=A0ABV2VE19_9ACTN